VTPDPSSNQETEAALICGLAKEKAAKRERCLSQASDFPPIPAPVRHDVIGDLGALNQRAEARVCTENLIRVDAVMESPKLAE
jgi:hypothetical protein